MGNASLRTFRTSVWETAALFTAALVAVQIPLTILKTTYDQPLARMFRNKFFLRRRKETISVSSSTPTTSTPGWQHTASNALPG